MRPIILITRMNGGGMETFALGLLRQWPQATLYTSFAGGVNDAAVPPGVERICGNVRARYSFWRLAKWLRTRPADPCLCLSQELAAVLVLLKRLHLIRNRIYLRESTDVEQHYDAGYWRTMFRVIPHLDGLIEQSRAGTAATRRILGHRRLPPVLVMRNIIAPQAVRRERPVGPTVRLFCIGSFKPMKGQEWLVANVDSALGQLGSNFWQLVFVGEGERRAACEALVWARGLGQRVEFRDWTHDTDAVYREADCVVIPSDYEGLPNVMLEAILSGVPVAVRPTCTGAVELLHELGLGETWPVARALAIPAERWAAARQRLATLTDPAINAQALMDFMGRRRILHLVPGLAEPANGIAVAANRIAAQQVQPAEVTLKDIAAWKFRDLAYADEVWVHSLWRPRTLAAALAAAWMRWRRGLRLVRMPHGGLDPLRLAHHWGKKRWLASLERWLLRRSDEIVATQPEETEWIWQFVGAKCPLVHCLDLRGAQPEAAYPPVRPLRCDGGNLRVLYLGRLHPLKGVEYLIRALPSTARLVCAGPDDGELAHLRQLAAESGAAVEFPGVVTGVAKERLWVDCDVLVLPTLSENFALVVDEALRHEMPVITTDGAPCWRDQPGVTYLTGYRHGTPEERVRLLHAALLALHAQG